MSMASYHLDLADTPRSDGCGWNPKPVVLPSLPRPCRAAGPSAWCRCPRRPVGGWN